MGPDLLGLLAAWAFLIAVLVVFALIDRIVCGAWTALVGSPGCGLVAGMCAWALGSTVDSRTATEGQVGCRPDGTHRDEPAGPVPTSRLEHVFTRPRDGRSPCAA